jgi:hypothetical protein
MFLDSIASISVKMKTFQIFKFDFSKNDIFHQNMKNDAVLSKIDATCVYFGRKEPK